MYEDVRCEEKEVSSTEMTLLLSPDSQNAFVMHTSGSKIVRPEIDELSPGPSPGDIPFLVIARHCHRHHHKPGRAHPTPLPVIGHDSASPSVWRCNKVQLMQRGILNR